MNLKKIIVFGSNGLVGNSLRRSLENYKDDFDIFFSTRNDTNLFSFNETSELITKFNPDIIINAAAKVGGIVANNTERVNFLIENIKINLNILESCIPNPKIKILNLGSSCIYPLNASNPISEDSFMDGKLEPTNSPYAMAKLTAIELSNSLNIQYGHQIINLMPTNLYGPNDNFSETKSHVIPGLIARMHKAKIEKKDKFDIWGTGKPLREFLHVDDLADAILFLIENKTSNTLVNVGSGEEISIKDLAELIKETIGFKGELFFDESMPDGNPRKLLDSSLINSYGWKPKISLEKGVRSTYEWFKNNN
ncbi:MAG: GDP-L-fucose synthase [Flavobacteriaceae bacterium]|nr:GDP-L-fucose synthase [Flavobacteriaceae bacterium]